MSYHSAECYFKRCEACSTKTCGCSCHIPTSPINEAEQKIYNREVNLRNRKSKAATSKRKDKLLKALENEENDNNNNKQ